MRDGLLEYDRVRGQSAKAPFRNHAFQLAIAEQGALDEIEPGTLPEVQQGFHRTPPSGDFL
jgi:hypothetical protein